ncbi:hypothetical protein BU26DRAFT_499099 [Trematosphaeria pertusa]|uniref:Uncharacterized protein n=1 Tax=Trematosphaeria pertusa TaxID=390896 RepID=A0A6A6J2K4_9PLEO|nr:uncharacterized protein BU26DRAFT_499099 [Trematosphaeria pertusa]KAF2256432.1 hypothetical protein BU26DRAFT_499099 [Trematosphaeria pertusa]
MRLTRAALRAEATQHIETADASNPHTDPKERVPLGEVSANAAIEPADPEEAQPQKMPAKKTKGRGGAKKSAKAKKGKPAEDDVDAVQVLENERQAAGSPASDAAVDELARKPTDDIAQRPVSDQRPVSPPSKAVRMTRRQLAKQDEELSKSQRARTPPRPEPAVEESVEDTTAGAQEEPLAESHAEPVAETEEEAAEPQEPETIAPRGDEGIEAQKAEATPDIEAQKPEVGAPSVEITSEPEPKTLTSEKTCEEEATPVTSRQGSRAPSRSPSKSPAKSPMRLEESIEAIDALEEALENVGKAIPIFDQSADEKSPKKAEFPRTVMSNAQGKMRKSPLASRVSRNPTTAPKSLKPTTRPAVSRSSSVRTASSKEARKGSGEVSDYLASKRRPISMSFPTPPPPPKSTKAPTKPSFQLPGEAIAAKLKAQKEERLKREAEARPVKQRPISMPPPPKSTKGPTNPNFQLPGEAVAAKLKAQKEERLKRDAEGEERAPPQIVLQPPPKSTKVPTVPNFQLPGEAIAAKLKAQKEERLKREEEAAEAAKKAAFKARPAPARKPAPVPVRQTCASKARESLMTKENVNGVTIPPPPQRTSSINAGKRGSMVLSRTMSTSSANSSHRHSAILNAGPVAKSTVTPADAAALKLKGKEVFNRDKLEKEARERERREKEEAAKRARAEAAERGRIASREWAEKQRKKMLAAAAAAAAPKVEEAA